MPHVLDVRLRVADLMAYGVALVVAREHGDVAVEGGGEEQGLAVVRGAVEEALHPRQEAHVGHAVGLVDDDDFDLVEVHVALADQVREAAGAGDEHVHPSSEGALLGLVADAAVDGDNAAATGAGDRSELALDLVRELTGGCEHQAARAARLRALDVDQQRQAEGERLAGAGRGARADIAAGEHVRDGGGLHLERCDEAELPEELGEALGNAEVGEGVGQSVSYVVLRVAGACSLVPHGPHAPPHDDSGSPPRPIRRRRGAGWTRRIHLRNGVTCVAAVHREASANAGLYRCCADPA